MSLDLAVRSIARPAPRRGFEDLGRELGITHVQVERWNEFAAALEQLQLSRTEFDARTVGCAQDAPADVEAVVNMQVTWARARLDALQDLRQRTHALCEVLTARQRRKANRLLQSVSMVV